MRQKLIEVGKEYAVALNPRVDSQRHNAVCARVLAKEQAREGSQRRDGVVVEFEHGVQRLLRADQIIRLWELHIKIIPVQLEKQRTVASISQGFGQGELVLIAGRSGEGKSMMMERIIRQGEVRGKHILYVKPNC